MGSKITVGKIVANATDTGWSQAYHAGGFTAVLSVVGKTEGGKALQETGKKLLDTLVSEYFTLTTKDLETVKTAVEKTIAESPQHVQVSLTVASVVRNILYVVIANQGRALLKRKDKLGLLLEKKLTDTEKITSVSGFLENGDVVLLHTPLFADIFPHDELALAFDNRSAEELSEYLAPKVHQAQDGSVSALVFSYHEDEPLPAPKTHVIQPQENKPPEKKFEGTFSHRQRLFLTIAVILGLVLIGSIIIFQQRQQQAKQQELFTKLYNPAKQKYDEATGLLSLNTSLAISDLQSAKDSLTAAKGKFDPNSPQTKQILSLLALVTTTLTDAEKVPLLQAVKAADNASPILSFAAKHDKAYVAAEGNTFYLADNTGITQYAKSKATGTLLIKNNNAYSSIGGFDTYFGNFYVLDQKGGIVKYVASGGASYAKSAYLSSGISPDFSKAVSIAIDSDIWVLTSDGNVLKFTKGNQDSLTVSGLDKPLSNPTQIFTTADLANVYILDKGNERIVVLKKDGSFVAQYASDTVRTTARIDVSEKNKEIYLLSNSTIYQLSLK